MVFTLAAAVACGADKGRDVRSLEASDRLNIEQQGCTEDSADRLRTLLTVREVAAYLRVRVNHVVRNDT